MFNKGRYVTAGIQAKIPVGLQIIMWDLIDKMDVSVKDCLQVFRLSISDGKQIVIHSQEEPDYLKSYSFDPGMFRGSAVEAKVFVIDDGDHCTMLLAEEY